MLEHHLHVNLVTNKIVIDAVDILIIVPSFLIVLVQRVRGRIGMEMSVLTLIASFMAASVYISPWYAVAFVPWLALLLGPVWSAQGFQGPKLILAFLWYFTCAVMFSYLLHPSDTDWLLYFAATSGIVVLSCVCTAFFSSLAETQWIEAHIFRSFKRKAAQ
jgi:hypothetical protein